MVFEEVIDTKYGKGLEIHRFSKNMPVRITEKVHLNWETGKWEGVNVFKDRFITGRMVEEPLKTSTGDEVMCSFIVYIRQGKQVVGFVNGIVSDWYHFFQPKCYDIIATECARKSGAFYGQFCAMDSMVNRFGLNRTVYKRVESEFPDFMSVSGFVAINRLWVDPKYRHRGYSHLMFDVIRKRYGSFITYCLCSLPFEIDDTSKMCISDRRIRIDTFEKYITNNFDEKKINHNRERMRGFFNTTHQRMYDNKGMVFTDKIWVYAYMENCLKSRVDKHLIV